MSVLFVDLENFTGLAESLDPEEVRAVQSRYFEVVRQIVAAHGGTIEKFIGDAVMAVWGAPLAHEDDAVRAVRAALAMLRAVARLGGAASGAALSARAAVTTGEAAVTIGAAGQGMVAGDVVNVAARLQAASPSGGVLVDEVTREAVAGAVDLEPAGALSLKGRSEPLLASRVVASTSAPSGDVAHGGPFVGRARELRELVDLFVGVARDRTTRLVTVTGIAGIGKSRLAWELGRQLDARPDDIAWHAGRAPAYGEGITFAALAEMVRSRIRAVDADSATIARRQLRAGLEELVRDEAERAWLEPRLAALLGDTDLAFEREELFAAWRRFFEHVADRAPAVFVFEDLQWADAALLDFVEHLATWGRDHPILIVALARPELFDHRAGWGTTVAHATTLHLERLPDAPMRELLLAQSPWLPEPTVNAVLERAGGVPLYAVEVARIVADAGTHDAADVEVPDSLRALIAARIDALPAPERRLLMAASVLGRRFPFEALVAVAGTDTGSVRQRLEGLRRRELLSLDERTLAPGRGQLAFVQDLVQEVAYRTLAREERRALHLAAARHIEGLEGDSMAEALADHLTAAHRLAPGHPDRRRIARRAVAALRLAASDAIRLHAAERALHHLERALELVDVPAQRALILDEAATAARAAARLDRAERYLRDLVALEHAANRPAAALRARARLGGVLLWQGNSEAALAELNAAASEMPRLADDAAGIELSAELARGRLLSGDAASAVELAERTVAAANRHGLDGLRVDALVTLGTARVRAGEQERGLEELRLALADAARGGHLGAELRARNNLAWLSVTDDPRVTFSAARDGYELALRMGVGDSAIQLAEVACSGAIETGDWQWVVDLVPSLEAGPVPDASRIGLRALAAVAGGLMGVRAPVERLEALLPLPDDTDKQVATDVAIARAWLALLGGDPRAAADSARSAADALFDVERAHALILLGRACLWAADADGTRRAFVALRELGLHGRAIAAAIGTLEAGLAALEGQPTASEQFNDAASAWRAVDLPFGLALCLVDAVRLGVRPARGQEHEEALRILDRLGASTLVGQLRIAGSRQ